jgi:hypothetical protein
LLLGTPSRFVSGSFRFSGQASRFSFGSLTSEKGGMTTDIANRLARALPIDHDRITEAVETRPLLN